MSIIKQISNKLNIILKLCLIIVGVFFIYASIVNAEAILYIGAKTAFVCLLILSLLNPMMIVIFKNMLAMCSPQKQIINLGLLSLASGILAAIIMFLGSFIVIGSSLASYMPYYITNGLGALLGALLVYGNTKALRELYR